VNSVIPASARFIWGLKRSGIHFFVNWLYANHGGARKDRLDADDLHPQLRKGFCDGDAGVIFFNNCGRLHSRNFGLGEIGRKDFEHALGESKTAMFGIEDCRLKPYVERIPSGQNVTNVLMLRDPLNNVASRLKGLRLRPQAFRVDATFVDLYDSYCREFLGWTNDLPNKVLVNYNRFVVDKGYRDSVAGALRVPNVDATAEVPEYGGGSSFRADRAPESPAALNTRYLEQPIPSEILQLLIERDAIREVCIAEFGYDLGELCLRLTGGQNA
jgi:hypothetical protein